MFIWLNKENELYAKNNQISTHGTYLENKTKQILIL